MQVKPYFFCVLRSADGSLQTRVTTEVEQSGATDSDEAAQPSLQLVYQKRYFNKQAALRREAEVQQWTNRQQEVLILGLADSYPAGNAAESSRCTLSTGEP